jgi:hypothetical protein
MNTEALAMVGLFITSSAGLAGAYIAYLKMKAEARSVADKVLAEAERVRAEAELVRAHTERSHVELKRILVAQNRESAELKTLVGEAKDQAMAAYEVGNHVKEKFEAVQESARQQNELSADRTDKLEHLAEDTNRQVHEHLPVDLSK